MKQLAAGRCRAPWPEWAASGIIVGQGNALGLPSDTGVTLLDTATGRINPIVVPVPPSAHAVALHAGVARIAFARHDRVGLLNVEGVLVRSVPTSLQGTVRALAFSFTGHRLWIGLERAEGEQPHTMVTLDGGTLELMSEVRVEGVPQALHHVAPHPTRADVAALNVMCGQDGAWLTLVDSGSQTVLRSVRSPDHPFAFGGFRCDGTAFAYLRHDGVELVDLSSGETVAIHELAGPWSNGYAGAFVGDRLVIVAESSDTPGKYIFRSLTDDDLSLVEDREALLLGEVVTRVLPQGYFEAQQIVRKNRISPADRKPEERRWTLYSW